MSECVCVCCAEVVCGVCELVLLQTPGREDLNDDNRVVVEGNQCRQMFSLLPCSGSSAIWGERRSNSHFLQKYTLFPPRLLTI